MQEDGIKRALMDALSQVAPESSATAIDASMNLQDQLDLDSVDILNYIIRVQKILNVEIPNQDFPKFLKMDDTVPYLVKKISPLQLGMQA